jgi:uncharacterized membrane protein
MFENSFQGTLRVLAHRRSLLLKTVGYRILSVIVTAVVAFVLLRDVSAALDVGIWANVVKMGVYYAYERAWSGWNPAGIRDLSP